MPIEFTLDPAIKTKKKLTKGSVDYANSIETKVVLIDGERLVDLMIDHNLGVSTKSTYEVKELDQDYFLE